MRYLFDTHCHLDDAAYDGDRDSVINELAAKMESILWCGTDLATSSMAAEYAKRHGFIYCACGYYPHQTQGLNSQKHLLEQLLLQEKCVAVGEIGLDYHYDGVCADKQREALCLQLEIAKQHRLPVILHERDALCDMLSILKEQQVSSGVIHCFSGSKETAKQYLDMGLNISFTGLLTFKNAKNAPEAAAYAPRERIMIETDSPYMTPVPFRGERNTPDRVALVAARLAEIWGVEPEEAAYITYQNACKLFNIRNTTAKEG